MSFHIFSNGQFSGVYEELYSMFPGTDMVDENLQKSKDTGYILFGFKTLAQEQRKLLESNWFEWTGAQQLFNYGPKSWNLKRMTFHKVANDNSSCDNRIFDFVLLCEFANIINAENVLDGCEMIERLKKRYCGFVGLYKVHWFYKRAPNPEKVTKREYLASISEETHDM